MGQVTVRLEKMRLFRVERRQAHTMFSKTSPRRVQSASQPCQQAESPCSLQRMCFSYSLVYMME